MDLGAKTGPSLGAQSQSQGGKGFLVVCSFAHRLLWEAFPPSGLQYV